MPENLLSSTADRRFAENFLSSTHKLGAFQRYRVLCENKEGMQAFYTIEHMQVEKGSPARSGGAAPLSFLLYGSSLRERVRFETAGSNHVRVCAYKLPWEERRCAVFFSRGNMTRGYACRLAEDNSVEI